MWKFRWFIVVALGFLLFSSLTACDSPTSISPPPSKLPSSLPETTPPTPAQEKPTTTPDEVKVVKVIDGDTIDVNIGGKTFTVRYIGVDTPETVHPSKPVEYFGQEASQKNRELVGGKIVRLEKDVSETDKYGRLLRYVWVGDMMVNAELVRLGYAQAISYPPDVKYQDLFLKLQAEARNNGRGLWVTEEQPTQPQPQPSPSPTGAFVGSKNSNVYHYPSCNYVNSISEQNKVWFSSSADAQAKGYRPCKVCKPP